MYDPAHDTESSQSVCQVYCLKISFSLLLFSPPPLCGCMSAESNYIAKPGDKIAARVKSDGDENWILAESVSFNTNSNKYTIDDIDEEGKE